MEIEDLKDSVGKKIIVVTEYINSPLVSIRVIVFDDGSYYVEYKGQEHE